MLAKQFKNGSYARKSFHIMIILNGEHSYTDQTTVHCDHIVSLKTHFLQKEKNPLNK